MWKTKMEFRKTTTKIKVANKNQILNPVFNNKQPKLIKKQTKIRKSLANTKNYFKCLQACTPKKEDKNLNLSVRNFEFDF